MTDAVQIQLFTGITMYRSKQHGNLNKGVAFAPIMAPLRTRCQWKLLDENVLYIYLMLLSKETSQHSCVHQAIQAPHPLHC